MLWWAADHPNVHVHLPVLASCFCPQGSFCQIFTNRAHEEIFIGIWRKLMFCIHLIILHKNIWEPPFLTDLYSGLPNRTADCRFWQFFFTTVQQTMDPKGLVFFRFPTSPLTLDLIKSTNSKLPRKKSISKTPNYIPSNLCRRLYLSNELRFKYWSFCAAARLV